MKKLIIILLITAPLFGEPFFNLFTIKNSFTLTCDDRQGAEKDCQYLNGTTGFCMEKDFSFPVSITACAFEDFIKTDLCSIKHSLEAEGLTSILKSPRYGAEVNFNSGSFYADIKGGTLSFSKTISRLKNPVPSAALNPFSQSFDYYTGTEGSLPYLSSGQVSPSLCANLSLKTGRSQLTAGAVSFNNKDAVFSAGIKINTKKNRLKAEETTENKNTLTAKMSPAIKTYDKKYYFLSTVTGGFFFLENTSSYLNKHKALFKSDYYYCGSWENFYSSPAFKALFSAGCHESPYSASSDFLWINSRISVVKGAFLFSGGYFILPRSKYSPRAVPMLGASSSIIKTVEQGFFNIQYTLLPENGRKITFGLSALENWKVQGSSQLCTLNTARIKGGFNAKGKILTLSQTFSASNLLLKGSPPDTSGEPETFWSAQTALKIKTSPLSFSFTGGYSHYPFTQKRKRTKDEIILKSALSPQKLKGITVSSSYSLNLKNGEKTKEKTELEAAFKIKRKHLYSVFKVILCLE